MASDWHQISGQMTLHQQDIQKANNVNLMKMKPNLKNNKASLNTTGTKIIKISTVVRLIIQKKNIPDITINDPNGVAPHIRETTY